MEVKEVAIEEIEQIQKDWADTVIKLGRLWQKGKPYKEEASQFVSRFYAYDTDHVQVLFKPTRASLQPFRMTHKGALSYFVGGDLDFPEDRGFALMLWDEIEFHNQGYYKNYNMATVMGHYDFINAEKNIISVEYTFGYIRTNKGELKIFLHHSSLPYSG
ncbi:MAG: hypothetical protein VX737_01205 [Pseudomonadota bacterium]|nr:hypothetical protein [Pseudomonadota bacterium]